MTDSKFSEEFYDRWQHLLEDIEMTDVPLRFVKHISVNLSDSSIVRFEVSNMLQDKLTVDEIEFAIEEFLAENDEHVANIDFHINIGEVAEEVTKKVKRLLG